MRFLSGIPLAIEQIDLSPRRMAEGTEPSHISKPIVQQFTEAEKEKGSVASVSGYLRCFVAVLGLAFFRLTFLGNTPAFSINPGYEVTLLR